MASWRRNRSNRRRSARNEQQARERGNRDTSPEHIVDPPGTRPNGDNLSEQMFQEYSRGIRALNSGESHNAIYDRVNVCCRALRRLEKFARESLLWHFVAEASRYIDWLNDALLAPRRTDPIPDSSVEGLPEAQRFVEPIPFMLDLSLYSQSQTDTLGFGDADASIGVNPHLHQSTSRVRPQQLPVRPLLISSHYGAQPLQGTPPQARRREGLRTAAIRRGPPIGETPTPRNVPARSEARHGVLIDPIYLPLSQILVIFSQASFAAQSNLAVPETIVSRFRKLETKIRRHTELEQVLSLVDRLRSVMDRLNSVLFSTLMAEENPLNIELFHNSSGGLGPTTYCKDCPRDTTFNRPQDFARHFRSQHLKLKLISCLYCSDKFSRLDLGKRHARRHSRESLTASAQPTGDLGADEITQHENELSTTVVGHRSDIGNVDDDDDEDDENKYEALNDDVHEDVDEDVGDDTEDWQASDCSSEVLDDFIL